MANEIEPLCERCELKVVHECFLCPDCCYCETCCFLELTAILESTDALPPGMHVCDTRDPYVDDEKIYLDCFEADLFELQLDVTPSRDLRARVAYQLRDSVSAERVETASRFRLLHWMLAQQMQLETVE